SHFREQRRRPSSDEQRPNNALGGIRMSSRSSRRLAVIAVFMFAAAALAGAAQPKSRKNKKDGLKYVWVPPGEFVMGCAQDCVKSDMPAHPVKITKGFWMGQTEVTV